VGDDVQEVVLVMRYPIDAALPAGVRPPLRFREPGRAFEGEVAHPRELVRRFEPMDTLDGATELVDQDGTVITLGTDDPGVIERNEYPDSYDGLFFVVPA
jgi:hypothetical protein